MSLGVLGHSTKARSPCAHTCSIWPGAGEAWLATSGRAQRPSCCLCHLCHSARTWAAAGLWGGQGLAVTGGTDRVLGWTALQGESHLHAALVVCCQGTWVRGPQIARL